MAKKRGLQGYTVQEAQNASLGQAGAEYISDDTSSGADIVAIQALGTTSGTGATTVTATSLDTGKWDSLSDVEVPAGVTIFGAWSSVTIGAGDAAILYRG
jgi:hypothetical protein